MPIKFGQLVIGPPGAGKTTYCQAMREYYSHFGRKTAIINLDPANEANIQVNIEKRTILV